MKKIIIRSALLAILVAVLIEISAYFNNWRPHFFSLGELGPILACSVFFTLIFIPTYLVVLKIMKERQILNMKVKLIIGAVATVMTLALLYADDEDGFEKLFAIGGVIMFLVYGFIIFISLVVLAFNRNWD